MVNCPLVTEEQVKEALGISTFRNVSKEKIMNFISLIPNMDKDVAISVITQFPEYAEMAGTMVEQLNIICESVMQHNDISTKASIEVYKEVLSTLKEMLNNKDITSDERKYVAEQMVLVADKVAAKDTENKSFVTGVLKFGSFVICGGLLLGAVILGVNVTGKKIPSLVS